MTTADQPLFSIVIPFFNNSAIAPECLPTAAALRRKNSAVAEIIAIDDCSIDGTAAWISKNHPDVTLLTNEQNLGFGRTCRRGIEKASSPWIILLNSDVKLVSDIVTPLIEDIRNHPDLFAISFYSFNGKNEKFEGQKKIVPKTGLFKTRNNFSGEYAEGVLDGALVAIDPHAGIENVLLVSG